MLLATVQYLYLCDMLWWASLILVQLSKLAEVGEVVPDCFKFIPGDVAIAVAVKVLEDGLESQEEVTSLCSQFIL